MDPQKTLLPVKVFVHGGFLQIGSTSGFLYNGQHHCAEERNEVRVLVGYRLSVLGFLAAKEPRLDVNETNLGLNVAEPAKNRQGNYGLKDIWTALEWVKGEFTDPVCHSRTDVFIVAGNIASFGGDPNRIHLTGLSGGAQAVLQMLHHASHRSPTKAPFITATMYSNAVISNPQDLDRTQNQFEVLCRRLSLDPKQSNILDKLRAIPSETLMQAVQSMQKLDTFRTVLSQDEWLKETVEYQRSAQFANGLRAAGIESVLLTEVSEEVILSSHSWSSPEVLINFRRSGQFIGQRTQPLPLRKYCKI